MLYGILILFMAVIVALDQWSKLAVVANIPLYGTVEAIPGLFHLTYVQNDGAAFSMLQGGKWLFAGVLVVGLVICIFLIAKKKITSKPELWCLAAVFGGGIGNFIDRLHLGYVVDMIAVDFLDFAVFNVADSFITCGAIALVIYVLFFDKKKEPPHDS